MEWPKLQFKGQKGKDNPISQAKEPALSCHLPGILFTNAITSSWVYLPGSTREPSQ